MFGKVRPYFLHSRIASVKSKAVPFTPLLVYDSQCKVCCRQLENLQFLVGKDRFQAKSFRDANFFEEYPQFDPEACGQAVQFQSKSGKVYSAAEACARALSLRLIFVPLTWSYYIPGVRSIWRHFYRYLAAKRFQLD